MRNARAAPHFGVRGLAEAAKAIPSAIARFERVEPLRGRTVGDFGAALETPASSSLMIASLETLPGCLCTIAGIAKTISSVAQPGYLRLCQAKSLKLRSCKI